MVDLMCAGPPRVYGAIGKGRLAAGYGWPISPSLTWETTAHRGVLDRFACGWTPFRRHGHHRLAGRDDRPGSVVMRDDTVVGTPVGNW